MNRGEGTFSRTELDISVSPREDGVVDVDSAIDDFKLPSSINFISLRESFVSDAPFISRANASQWRKILDSDNFKTILSTNYHILVNSISESGSFDLEALYKFQSPAVDMMAESFSHMYYLFNVKERDTLLPKMAEICTYMAISCLSTSHPKHNRLYSSMKFRELLLDYFSEIFTGIRLSSCRLQRDWLFQNAVDQKIVVMRAENAPELRHNPSRGSNKTTYRMINSPLVTRYMRLKENSICTYGANLSLSHLPERPLTTISEYSTIHTKKARTKQIHHDQVKHALRESRKARADQLSEHEANKKNYREDVRKLKSNLSLTMTWLKNTEREKLSKSRQDLVSVLQSPLKGGVESVVASVGTGTGKMV